MGKLRVLGFYGVALFMGLGPMLRQVFHLENRVVRAWVMFHGEARDVCAVRFVQIAADGARQPLDAGAILGDHLPRTIDSGLTAWRLGRMICLELGGEADVRVSARCASLRGDGWRRELGGDVNVCRSPGRGPAP